MKNADKKNYYIYILRCENNILYTGITTDVARRFAEHKKENGSKKGAKFTKSHLPEKIVALWITKTRSDALKLEARIKKLKKEEKEYLIDDNALFKEYFNDLKCIGNYRRVNRGKYA